MNDSIKVKLKKKCKIWGIVLVIGITYYIISKVTNFAIPCLFHLITKLNCPGCGITRMINAILSFDFDTAPTYNYFLYYSSPIILLLMILEIDRYLFDTREFKSVKYTEHLLLISLIIWFILRNIFKI